MVTEAVEKAGLELVGSHPPGRVGVCDGETAAVGGICIDFFVEPGQVHMEEKQIVITGSDVNHMRNVLRMKPGEEISVSDESGREYTCTLKERGNGADHCPDSLCPGKRSGASCQNQPVSGPSQKR